MIPTNEHLARLREERGSALLIVFVFAAILAITLYAELPVVAFEAKRQKEQLLIDRGHEYAHAVKLFVRKFGMYPASFDQLENTNRMRFLRHRFKDPFTGKDDWRLLHAGPGGMIVDSRVTPPGGANQLGNGTNSSSGFGSNGGASSSSFGSTGNSSFGSSGGSSFGSSGGSSFGSTGTTSSSGFGQGGFGSSSQSGDGVVVPPLPQRPPAISSSGTPSLASGNGENASAPAENDQSPTAPLLPPGETEQMAGTAQNGNPAQPGNAAGNAQAGQNNLPGQAPVSGASDSQNAMDTVRKMLNNPAIGAPLPGSGTNTGSAMGQISGGGIAGVASKAKGRTIKTINDQTDYSLWEFYYDPTKDATRNMPGLGQAGVGQGGTQPGANTTGANTGIGQQSSFGSSSFGQGNSSQSGFGQSGSSQGGFNQSTPASNPAPASPSNFGAAQPPPQ